MPRPNLNLQIVQRQKMVPKMMIASELMVMNVMELEERLVQLGEENPLLDMQEHITCYKCGAIISGYPESCPICGHLLFVREKREFPWEDAPLSGTKKGWKEVLREEVETFVELSPGEEEIFYALLASLDSSGFLGVELDRFSFSLQKREEEVEKVVTKIREAGFLGFACRDALEFLLLQLQNLGIMERKDLKTLRREVLQNPDAFQRMVIPHLPKLFHSPAQFFEASLGREQEEIQQEETTVVPDAEIVEVAKGEFEVVLYTPPSLRLSINEEVLALFKKKKSMSAKELAFWQERIKEAKEVVSCLSYRHRLLFRVLEYIVEQEKNFLVHGFTHFVPLRQKDIAQALGISVSAVCQILKNKYLRFPDGVVRKVKFFFDASYPVKEAIRMVLKGENPQHPLSDEEIVMELHKRGISIARRTCALYREEMGILSSHFRKKISAK